MSPFQLFRQLFRADSFPIDGCHLFSFLVILVHQGIDPTLPYQTLCDPRERQAFPRLCALGTNKTFSAPSACLPHVGSTVPDDGDCITLAASSASSAGRISPSGWGPWRRFC